MPKTLPQKPRTYEVTAGKLRAYIQSEHLKPSMRLPSEQALATKLCTSRPTLRAGLLTLELSGEIEIVNGSGAYIRDAKRSISIDIEDTRALCRS